SSCGPGRKNGSARGRTKECPYTGGTIDPRYHLTPNPKPSTKPGQVQALFCQSARGPARRPGPQLRRRLIAPISKFLPPRTLADLAGEIAAKGRKAQNACRRKREKKALPLSPHASRTVVGRACAGYLIPAPRHQSAQLREAPWPQPGRADAR